jgi:hypothetical protein
MLGAHADKIYGLGSSAQVWTDGHNRHEGQIADLVKRLAAIDETLEQHAGCIYSCDKPYYADADDLDELNRRFRIRERHNQNLITNLQRRLARMERICDGFAMGAEDLIEKMREESNKLKVKELQEEQLETEGLNQLIRESEPKQFLSIPDPM